MDDFNRFRMWLDINTTYTKETKSNILSRLKRANKICPVFDEPVYLFNLSRTPGFQKLTVSVKSQIKRSVKIYYEFMEYERLNSYDEK